MLWPTKSAMIALKTINKLSEQLGKPPTRREIQLELGHKSTASVQLHLKSLKEFGLIDVVERSRRGIKIKPRGFIALSAFE